MTDKTPEFIEEPGSEPAPIKKSVVPAKAEPHPDDPEVLLTPAQIEEIKKQARAEIMADKRGKAKQELLAAEKLRLQRDEGLTTGNRHADEILSITIDLAPYAPYININSQCYYHGRTYQVPRHVADTLRDQMFQTWKHQNQIDGKDAAQFYSQKHVAEMFKVAGGAKLSGRAA